MDSARSASSIVVTRWKVSRSSYEVSAMESSSLRVSYLLGSNTQVSVDALQDVTSVLRQCPFVNIDKDC